MGITPIYDPSGNVVRITGGSGDLALMNKDRYEPSLPQGLSKTLYDLVMGVNGEKLGYQGRGAYTGFIEGRKNGQTGLMSTYRFKVLPENGRRWIPSVINSPKMGAPLGIQTNNERRSWGMIGDNCTQCQLKQQGMFMKDEQKGATFVPSPVDANDIVGYVHGMIQAIYDVVWRNDGIPYEIAVGNQTTKLASCFPCAIFMEATNHPASSTHLGRGESWCILHPEGDIKSTESLARTQCNDKWASYCQTIITRGMACMAKSGGSLVNDTHQYSFAALQTYLHLQNNNKPTNQYLYANLILDALTVHKSEFKRVNDTLKP